MSGCRGTDLSSRCDGRSTLSYWLVGRVYALGVDFGDEAVIRRGFALSIDFGDRRQYMRLHSYRKKLWVGWTLMLGAKACTRLLSYREARYGALLERLRVD